ncbi:MAG: hypothetical protein ABIU05_18030 [Nitrospirales bacterium]
MAVTNQGDVVKRRLSLSVKTTVTVIFALIGLGAVSDSAMAERVKLGSAAAKNAMSSCKGTGGVTFPKTGGNSTFGCMNGDGSGIVCGGVKKSDKKTCDTFLQIPPRLPTRDEVLNAEMAVKE